MHPVTIINRFASVTFMCLKQTPLYLHQIYVISTSNLVYIYLKSNLILFLFACEDAIVFILILNVFIEEKRKLFNYSFVKKGKFIYIYYGFNSAQTM